MNISKRFLTTGGATMVVTGSVAIAGIALSPMAIADFGAVTATTAVNIRTSPSLRGNVVGVLYTGQKLTQVAPITNGWVPVSYGGQTRYIASAYLLGAKLTAVSPATNDKGTTGQAWTTAVLNVRPFASINNTPIGLLQKGAPVTLTGLVSGQFSQITYGDGLAWVATSYLSSAKPDSEGNTTLIVGSVRAKTALAVRTAAGDDTGAADIPGGTVLPTTGRKSTSLTEVVWQNARVWVTSYWVEALSNSSPSVPTVPSTIGTRYATTDVNVRSGPGTSYSIVGSLPQGGETQVTGTVTNGFAAVVVDGATRWVSAQYLSSTKPAPLNPSPPVGGDGLNLRGSSGLAGLEPNARNIVNVIASKWGLTTFYGVRADPLPDHPSGHAVDAMIPNYRSASQNALGWEIASYLRANARALGVQYVIWDQKIWNIARDKEGWRSMADRGGDTANHKDHVHVTTVGL
ncbi:SH3 domain-containing protein [Aestuariimicrobium sp. p3-SID1156]|uniref:SH3 domain-containing protein n=1 Tax=Aestuariimicrobium sp. p3-SID1156 TaxID=2916038 RepID=UPI00223BA2A3|nr:SH3 domain-containing protein [Aestuariimicrobium sp. p3-SID1156]MCT1458737.1 SH3 domain-containing protein [Aestuariimicrobium sp. p3-SID1156]